MTLCVFALIALEFMPVSLLTPMAAGLHVSEGIARNGITILGRAIIGVVIGGFWSVPAATAMQLVPPRLVPHALAIFNDESCIAPWSPSRCRWPLSRWRRIARTLPKDAEAGGLMVAVIQLFIALGSTVGGLLFDMSGYRSTFMASAVVLVVAIFLALLTPRADRAKAA